jgi:hypothetical protein
MAETNRSPSVEPLQGYAQPLGRGALLAIDMLHSFRGRHGLTSVPAEDVHGRRKGRDIGAKTLWRFQRMHA